MDAMLVLRDEYPIQNVDIPGWVKDSAKAFEDSQRNDPTAAAHKAKYRAVAVALGALSLSRFVPAPGDRCNMLLMDGFELRSCEAFLSNSTVSAHVDNMLVPNYQALAIWERQHNLDRRIQLFGAELGKFLQTMGKSMQFRHLHLDLCSKLDKARSLMRPIFVQQLCDGTAPCILDVTFFSGRENGEDNNVMDYVREDFNRVTLLCAELRGSALREGDHYEIHELSMANQRIWLHHKMQSAFFVVVPRALKVHKPAEVTAFLLEVDETVTRTLEATREEEDAEQLPKKKRALRHEPAAAAVVAAPKKAKAFNLGARVEANMYANDRYRRYRSCRIPCRIAELVGDTHMMLQPEALFDGPCLVHQAELSTRRPRDLKLCVPHVELASEACERLAINAPMHAGMRVEVAWRGAPNEAGAWWGATVLASEGRKLQVQYDYGEPEERVPVWVDRKYCRSMKQNE